MFLDINVWSVGAQIGWYTPGLTRRMSHILEAVVILTNAHQEFYLSCQISNFMTPAKIILPIPTPRFSFQTYCVLW